MVQSKESDYSRAVRSRIILVMAIFVLLFGAPLFVYTTRVHRAELPVNLLNDRLASFDDLVKFLVPIYVNTTSQSTIADIQMAAEEYLVSNTALALSWGVRFEPYTEDINSYEHYVLTLIEDNSIENKDAAKSFVLSPYSKGVTVFLPSLDAQSTSQYICEVLFNQVFHEEIASMSSLKLDSSTSDMSFPYSTEYNVVFNLFVQDGSPVTWDIESALLLMQPIFHALKHYCAFKVSTQIHYYSKLKNDVVYNEELKANVLSQNDLSTFINFGEWNLNSHEKSPSINFIIYFKDLNHKNIPLLVEGSKTNSFAIPQWGGVHIYNPPMPLLNGSRLHISEKQLHGILDIFASHLFELLGVPSSPVSPLMRIDTFQRLSTYKNLRRSLDNLYALVKLSNSLSGISIPEATKSNVLDSLRLYDQAVNNLQQADFALALENAGQSLGSSDKAFFEKEMLQQAHFPNEHKLAVFLPLLGPICSIVIFGIIKRLKGWRKERADLSVSQKEKKNI